MPGHTQNDQLVESLRLELAEAQIKMMEVDGAGGTRIHDLERRLMEVKIENARLLEDNESFQLLLSEKTLNGDFGKIQESAGLSSLAEELGESLGDQTNQEHRRHELEVKSLKDQNRALSLYVEKIIGRLLEHKDFENIFDKNPDLMSGAPTSLPTDQAPPLPPKDGGFLQRARSVVAGSGKRARPISQTMPPSAAPTPHEDPATAPSVPLGRTRSVRNSPHKADMPHAAPIVNQMYRGPPSSGHPVPLGSPGLSPSSSVVRNSFFPPYVGSPSSNARSISGGVSTTHQRTGSSATSILSDVSGPGDLLASSETVAPPPPPTGSESPPRATGLSSSTSSNFTGAVMTQNKLRPLRLLQESAESEAARKKANRSSWMPTWMGPRTTTD